MTAVLLLAALLAVIFGAVKVVLFKRRRSMRALASRLGFQYHGSKLPNSFSMSCYPADEIAKAWNVIQGQRNGIDVLIFDSLVGKGKPVYCTFIAGHTESKLFGTDVSPERLACSSGWTALYRIRFLQIPWTMGIKRIEEHLTSLTLSRG